jgi:hypothetical protein
MFLMNFLEVQSIGKKVGWWWVANKITNLINIHSLQSVANWVPHQHFNQCLQPPIGCKLGHSWTLTISSTLTASNLPIRCKVGRSWTKHESHQTHPPLTMRPPPPQRVEEWVGHKQKKPDLMNTPDPPPLKSWKLGLVMNRNRRISLNTPTPTLYLEELKSGSVMNKKPISSTSVPHSPHPPTRPPKTPKKRRKRKTEVGCKYRCKKGQQGCTVHTVQIFCFNQSTTGWIRYLNLPCWHVGKSGRWLDNTKHLRNSTQYQLDKHCHTGIRPRRKYEPYTQWRLNTSSFCHLIGYETWHRIPIGVGNRLQPTCQQ